MVVVSAALAQAGAAEDFRRTEHHGSVEVEAVEQGSLFETLDAESVLPLRSFDEEAVERAAFEDVVRAFRISTSRQGEGFAEAIANSTRLGIPERKPGSMRDPGVDVLAFADSRDSMKALAHAPSAAEIIRPHSDFRLHESGAKDRIPLLSPRGYAAARQTAPLWDVRTRDDFVREGPIFRSQEAIELYQTLASAERYEWLSSAQKRQLLNILDSPERSE